MHVIEYDLTYFFQMYTLSFQGIIHITSIKEMVSPLGECVLGEGRDSYMDLKL